MRGHSSSFYIDIALIFLGVVLLTFEDYVTGIILLALGLGIHFLMGE